MVKQRIFAILLSLTMMFTLVPTAWAEGESGAGTSSTVQDVDGNYWTFTTSENSITMEQGDNHVIAKLDGGVLTFSGTGAMPVLNDSTDAVSGSKLSDYPWANWEKSVTKIVIGNGITGVGAKSFITWQNVTTVELGKDVKTIGAGAFAQLTACTQFTVDASNTSFEAENGVLYSKGQEKLYYYPCTKTETEFNVPDTVTELGYNAVCKNDFLQTVSFTGEKALHFGYGSMFGNTALTTVNLDRPNVTFDTLVFSNDAALKVVYCTTSEVKGAANKLMNDTQSGAVALLKGGEYDKKENGYIYAVDSENAIIYGYEGNDTVLELPNELGEKAVTVIAANTFANLNGNRNITKVTIPATVKSIEPNAFLGGKDYHNYDSTLTDITILGRDVEIGSMAFARHQNLRIDMTKVANLKADSNAFSSVSKIIISKDAQEVMRTALAENSSVNQNTKVYIDTDENNAFYWHYENDKWAIVSSGTSSFKDEQGLIYKVNYTVEEATVTATAEITGYNKPETSTATELVIPKTLPFTDASGNKAQATVVSITGLRGYNDKPVKNGIKTLTVKADLPSLNTTFVYWNDLETVNILGNVASLVNCFTGCSALKQVYFGDQENITFGSSAFGNVPHLGVIDLSDVKNVTMTSTTGYSNAITNFYSNTPSNVTMVYVGNEDVYQTINTVTFASTVEEDNGKTVTKSGFDSNHNIVAITNGGTFPADTSFESGKLATPVKVGYTAEWHEKADFSDTAVGTPVAGKTYYAKWTMADSISLTSNAASSVTYGTTVTLKASPVNSSWGYVWYKDANENGKLELSTDKQINNNKCTLALTDVSDSGTYWVQVTDGSSIKTSNAINVDITKADVTNTAKENAHHTFGTTYDVSNLFGIDPNAGEATYALVENPDENAGAATLEGNILTITKAGVIKVSLTTAETDNYNATSAVTATLIVDKAAPTVKITADQTSLTGSGTVKLTVTSNGVPEKGTVTVTCDNGITVTENAGGTFSAVLPNETKTYTFTASYGGDANHEKASGTCWVSVTRRSSSGGSSSSGSSYAVSTPSAKNGDVTVSPKNASKGDRVTVTVKPDSGYEIGSVTVLDSKGNELKLTDKGNGKYTFTMPGGKVEVKATFIKAGETSIFVDVPADSYYFDAVKWAQKLGITNGKTDALFGANDPCTRGQIVTFLWRAAGSPAPKGTAKVPGDVLPGSYCYDAVAWAIENGVTNGFADGTFGVNNTCTRGQSVTFLYRALGTAPTTVNGFTDVAVGDFYAEAVAWAVENGVTNGTTDSTFSPSNGCTRAQIVTFLYRAKN